MKPHLRPHRYFGWLCYTDLGRHARGVGKTMEAAYQAWKRAIDERLCFVRGPE